MRTRKSFPHISNIADISPTLNKVSHSLGSQCETVFHLHCTTIAFHETFGQRLKAYVFIIMIIIIITRFSQNTAFKTTY